MSADDLAAIQNLKARYCAAVDGAAGDLDGARAALAAVFMPDVVGDYGFRVFEGAAELADFLCTSIASGSEWAIHTIHSPMITVEGDRASGSWTVIALLKRRGGGQVDQVVGRYSDEFARTGEGWRIGRVGFSRLA